jgi:UDP-3-O-[3-hydroxymyristoyl] glucosamine N-acyltransferase
VHPQAWIDPSATLGAGVTIGPGCYIGPRVVLGDRCLLHAGARVLDDCTLGEDCELYPGVVIRERCRLGRRVVLQPNAVIGADGFNYRPSPDGRRLIRLTHIGAVRIEDDVEIGAATCVDRGKFGDTVIGAGSKIDNLCQIAHNCVIGRMCVIAAHVGVAGSARVGDGVMIGGEAGIREHAVIGAGARIMACSAVMGDVPAGETWGGVPAAEARTAWRMHAALRQLPDLVKQLRQPKA